MTIIENDTENKTMSVDFNTRQAGFFFRQLTKGDRLSIDDLEIATSIAQNLVNAKLWGKKEYGLLHAKSRSSMCELEVNIKSYESYSGMKTSFFMTFTENLRNYYLYNKLLFVFENHLADVNETFSSDLSRLILLPLIAENQGRLSEGKTGFGSIRIDGVMQNVDVVGERIESFFKTIIEYGSEILNAETIDLLKAQIGNCVRERKVIMD
jgi:hypothetical protein